MAGLKYGDLPMNIKRLAAGLGTILVVLMCNSWCHAAEEPLGSFSAVSGSVAIQRSHAEAWIPAQVNMSVYFGDTVRSGPGGEGEIVFNDESLLKINPNSKLAINTIISPVEKKNSVLLFFGRIWSKISRTALNRKSFEVQTPTAVCGVRGTDFTTAAYEDGTMLVQVASGRVEVNNETSDTVLAANQGARVSFATRQIAAKTDFQPQWRQEETSGRQNLFADGKKYGGHVHRQIRDRRDQLKELVDKAARLAEAKADHLAAAQQAREQGDDLAYEENMDRAARLNAELKALNRQIAYSGRRLECQFGLFAHYGNLAQDPVLSKQFKGKDFILQQLDDVEAIQAEFNAMIEEGMKISMEDMEDLMDEMRLKMQRYKDKQQKSDPFEEMDRKF
jgi:Tfp pilus assembly protein FimT